MKKAQRKKRRTVPIPIASMGDIAFLLIIFFLVCSEITKDKSLPITPPVSPYVEKMKSGVAARVAIDREGQIYLDGLPVENVKDVEWGVRALLERTVADEQRRVQFNCDATLPKEMFEPVLKAIAEGGGIIEAVGNLNEERP